jgi:hypothetical protein
LSEARKYGLNLTVANQYISQMNETVRDAVFGNVGTMISFRVSADDAPILSKQFEPQFESNDLLQMHNRNFVINMVINGEKSPAFSARTLELPPPQTDNTGRIIENTRRSYSKSRAEVEAAISAVIQPPQQFQPKKPPVSQTMAKQWPVNAQTQTVTPQAQQPPKPATATQQGSSTAQTVPTAPQGAIGSGEAPAKRKRTRRRKKPATASTSSEQSPATTAAPAQQPTNNDHELKLR